MTNGSRRKAFYYCAATLALGAVAIAPAIAQFPPTPDDTNPPLVGTPKGKKKGAAPPAAAAGTGPGVVGTWAGELTQVGGQAPYKFEIAINAGGGSTKYADLDCIGKLNRVGASKSYVFFVEIITKGQAEKGGRCPDGTITVARQGADLAVGWFGSIQDTTVVAYGTLKKK